MFRNTYWEGLIIDDPSEDNSYGVIDEAILDSDFEDEDSIDHREDLAPNLNDTVKSPEIRHDKGDGQDNEPHIVTKDTDTDSGTAAENLDSHDLMQIDEMSRSRCNPTL